MVIYKITHIPSNRCYIGQTIQDPNVRFMDHLYKSEYSKNCFKIHNAIKKYGKESFTFEVIDTTASSLEQLNLLEELYIEKFNSIVNGFNLRTGGGNKLHSAESKEKMRESQKAAHRRRRDSGTEGGWTRKDGGAMLGKSHPGKGKTNKNKGMLKGKTWEEIYGIEGARIRRDSIKNRKSNV